MTVSRSLKASCHDASLGCSSAGCAMALLQTGTRSCSPSPPSPAMVLSAGQATGQRIMNHRCEVRGVPAVHPPPADRFGDYVHCTGRIVNIFFKRLVPISIPFHCRAEVTLH